MSKREQSNLARKLENDQENMVPDQVVLERNKAADDAAPRSRAQAPQFPTDGLAAKEKQDKLMSAKLALQTADKPGVTPFGQLTAKESDFQWLQRKQAAAEVANFQQWFAAEFDLMDPASKAKAKELYPEFYAQRKKLLKKQAKNLVRLANIKLEGIQNRNDLITTWEAETGRLDLGPLENLLNPERSTTQNNAARRAQNFKRGVFSPWTVYGDEGWNATGNELENRQQRANQYVANIGTAGQSLGVTTGFPPMGNKKPVQNTEAWFDTLLARPPTAPEATATANSFPSNFGPTPGTKGFGSAAE